MKYRGPLAKPLPPPKKKQWRANPISARRREQNVEYAKAIRSFRAAHPNHKFCFVCLKENRARVPVQDNHHIRGRAGSLFCDQRFFMSICRRHHNWIDANREKAALRGYLDMDNWNCPP